MVSRYENGQAVPRLDTLGRLLEGLGATLPALGWALQVVRETQDGPLELPKHLPSADRAALQTAARMLCEIGEVRAARDPASEPENALSGR